TLHIQYPALRGSHSVLQVNSHGNFQLETETRVNPIGSDHGDLWLSDAADYSCIAKLSGAKFEVDPGLHAQYGQLRSQLKSGFNNPLGANYSPEVRDAIIRSGEERLGQQEAEAYRGGQYDANRLGYSRDVTVAGMSQPQLTQTGGTTTGT